MFGAMPRALLSSVPSARVFRRRHASPAVCRRRPRLRCLAFITGVSFFATFTVMPAAQLTVRWDDNSASELGFKIERSSDGLIFSSLASVGPNVTSYIDSSVKDGTAYWYRVRAYSSTATSPYSNITSGSTSTSSTSSSSNAPGRLQAFTFRANAGISAVTPLEQTFTVDAANKNIVLRGVGPTLSIFTALKTLTNPRLFLYSSTSLLASNDNWGGTLALIALFDQVGAYAIPGYGDDAAIYANLAPMTYRCVVTGDDTGLAQSELYDADTASIPAGRISKTMIRGGVGTGGGVLIGGFVIAGDAPMKLLIRAIGPGLGTISNVLADPVLSVYRGSTLVARNDNWGGSSTLVSAFSAVGASSLSASSKDSALITTLSPGVYSSYVAGVGGTTGIARLEFYELK